MKTIDLSVSEARGKLTKIDILCICSNSLNIQIRNRNIIFKKSCSSKKLHLKICRLRENKVGRSGQQKIGNLPNRHHNLLRSSSQSSAAQIEPKILECCTKAVRRGAVAHWYSGSRRCTYDSSKLRVVFH